MELDTFFTELSDFIKNVNLLSEKIEKLEAQFLASIVSGDRRLVDIPDPDQDDAILSMKLRNDRRFFAIEAKLEELELRFDAFIGSDVPEQNTKLDELEGKINEIESSVDEHQRTLDDLDFDVAIENIDWTERVRDAIRDII